MQINKKTIPKATIQLNKVILLKGLSLCIVSLFMISINMISLLYIRSFYVTVCHYVNSMQLMCRGSKVMCKIEVHLATVFSKLKNEIYIFTYIKFKKNHSNITVPFIAKNYFIYLSA